MLTKHRNTTMAAQLGSINKSLSLHSKEVSEKTEEKHEVDASLNNGLQINLQSKKGLAPADRQNFAEKLQKVQSDI